MASVAGFAIVHPYGGLQQRSADGRNITAIRLEEAKRIIKYKEAALSAGTGGERVETTSHRINYTFT